MKGCSHFFRLSIYKTFSAEKLYSLRSPNSRGLPPEQGEVQLRNPLQTLRPSSLTNQQSTVALLGGICERVFQALRKHLYIPNVPLIILICSLRRSPSGLLLASSSSVCFFFFFIYRLRKEFISFKTYFIIKRLHLFTGVCSTNESAFSEFY